MSRRPWYRTVCLRPTQSPRLIARSMARSSLWHRSARRPEREAAAGVDADVSWANPQIEVVKGLRLLSKLWKALVDANACSLLPSSKTASRNGFPGPHLPGSVLPSTWRSDVAFMCPSLRGVVIGAEEASRLRHARCPPGPRYPADQWELRLLRRGTAPRASRGVLSSRRRPRFS